MKLACEVRLEAGAGKKQEAKCARERLKRPEQPVPPNQPFAASGSSWRHEFVFAQTHASKPLRLMISYQTRQDFTGFIGLPWLQLKAFPNSSKFCTLPFTRQRPGECGSVSAACRAD